MIQRPGKNYLKLSIQNKMKNKFLILVLACLSNVLQLSAQKTSDKFAVIKIKTSGHCGECKKTIEKAMTFEKGIRDASFNPSDGILTVTYNTKKTDPDKIRKAVSLAGYDADEIAADSSAYEKLKACCKKDGRELMK